MNPQLWWYFARASGMVAAVLLVASLVWGVLMATRALKPVDRPAWMLAMHRWFSGLAVTGVAIHIAALVADSYVHFGAKEILVPMSSSWKPGAVTLGVVAMYLLVLVQATSLAMKRLPKRVWRGIHMSSYVLTWLVFVHAGLAGTDVANRVYQGVALLLIIVAVTAAVLRVTMGRAGRGTGHRGSSDSVSARVPSPIVPADPKADQRPLPPPSGAAVPLGDPLISRQHRDSELVG
ncbi:MAG: ferric reductase-like transmembrane domain-containing protein [Actinomycetota bacterium]